ncbi:putative ferredoxin, 2Fe-2S type, ISC system [Candidatus Nasuia deltocephalinicola]|nr:putative ferredoxin, 2Fe-2S type, ISC system [Candidatus Nasuia deltocephalinicola]
MSKIIILPNKNLINGFIIHLNKDLLLNSLCDILLKNNIEISHVCEKFGKCNTCKITVKEGLKFLNKINFDEEETLLKYSIFDKNIRLSCQLFIKNNYNIIISIN